MKIKTIIGFLSLILFSCQEINKDSLNLIKPTPSITITPSIISSSSTPDPTFIPIPSSSSVFSATPNVTSTPSVTVIPSSPTVNPTPVIAESASFVSGCTSATIYPSIPVQALLNYPDNVEINNDVFKLEASLSKNTTPTTGARDCSEIRLTLINKSFLLLNFKVKHFWLINDQEVWETSSSANSTQQFVYFGGGPIWPNDKVYYAVIEATDEQGKSFFIKSGEVKIQLNS